MQISVPLARRLALQSQGLDGQWLLPEGKEGVAQAIQRLGYVQIDTIAVVRRAHHHVIWSRRPDYDEHMLDDLLARDRRVFEWWAPAASYLPYQDYRYYLPAMRRYAASPSTRHWLEQNAQLVQGVRDRIQAEGPLGSADFEAPAGFRRGGWWSRKPAKQALELLFSTGELMVSERRGFQRIYDLRERVLPPETDLREPDEEEMQRFTVRRALGGLGVAPLREIVWGRTKATLETVHDMIDSGEVVQLEGLAGDTHYALAAAVQQLAGQAQGSDRLHILSPFDNLVIRRGWLKRLFGYDFRLECYTPAAERRFGYFALPVLWGNEFEGRVDCKAERDRRTLVVRRLTFERVVSEPDRLLPALASRLHDLAAFNGCDSVRLETTDPGTVRAPLARELEASD